MEIQIKQNGKWESGRRLLRDDAKSDIVPFLKGIVERLREDGFEARIVSEKSRTAKTPRKLSA